MSATASDPAPVGAGPPASLPAEMLPASVQKLLAGAGPMKLMAAKGMAPLRPAELAIAVYQLTFDADASVKAAAEAAPAVLPDRIVTPALAEVLPAAVLHFFASRLAPTRGEALEKLLYNPATADPTFVLLAGRMAERELEIVFENEARILRCPAILAALYTNPAARMSSLNRAIELCARNGVRPDGIPAFDEVVKSIAEETADPAAVDASFAGALAATSAVTELPAPGPVAEATAEETKEKKKSTVIDFTRLKLHEKIRLATMGNAYCRQNLVRDPNRIVAMAAIRSPRISDSEVITAAGNRAVCEDVVRYIANQRDYVKSYQVRMSLVQNPKCPMALSLRFLSTLQADDVKLISRSKNVPAALSTAARRLITTRKGGEGGGSGH
jgi:hypothetical protein